MCYLFFVTFSISATRNKTLGPERKILGGKHEKLFFLLRGLCLRCIHKPGRHLCLWFTKQRRNEENIMNTAQPIRNAQDLQRFKEYYQVVCPNTRNHLLLVTGLNTALRISDILHLKWEHVYDFGTHNCKEHLYITEQKTDKKSMVLINGNLKEALLKYKEHLDRQGTPTSPGSFLFENSNRKGHPITRVQAFRIIKKAAAECHLNGVISCHSLRKTFGYHAWQQGIKPALLMNIYNHSSFQTTVRYLGIEQDDRDSIFRNIDI